jgi:S-adenosylmethionine decarboxylase
MVAPTFNNLTKCLSFNLYDFAVGRTAEERESYAAYVREHFSADKVTALLTEIASIIDADVINVSQHDFDPNGASSLVLMSDTSVNLHLDKSHICAHTYLDLADPKGICSFRVDIDIATCGNIVPLKALDHMLTAMRWNDVVVIDYVVRGFTRDAAGERVTMDHDLDSILDHIAPSFVHDFHAEDWSWDSHRIWQTRLLRMRYNVVDYFPEGTDVSLPDNRQMMARLQDEMRNVFHH